MSENGKLPDIRTVITAAAVWLLCAVVLLCAGTLTANAAGLGEQALGYLSSAISFVCAVAAGIAAARRRRAPRLITALVTGTALVILLLTSGFLIKGSEMDPSSLLSVVSFSYAGVLLGVFLSPGPGRRGTRSAFRHHN